MLYFSSIKLGPVHFLDVFLLHRKTPRNT